MSFIIIFIWGMVIVTIYKIIDILLFEPAREAKRKAESTQKINEMILKALVDADVDSAKIGEVTKIMMSKEDKEE